MRFVARDGRRCRVAPGSRSRPAPPDGRVPHVRTLTTGTPPAPSRGRRAAAHDRLPGRRSRLLRRCGARGRSPSASASPWSPTTSASTRRRGAAGGLVLPGPSRRAGAGAAADGVRAGAPCARPQLGIASRYAKTVVAGVRGRYVLRVVAPATADERAGRSRDRDGARALTPRRDAPGDDPARGRVVAALRAARRPVPLPRSDSRKGDREMRNEACPSLAALVVTAATVPRHRHRPGGVVAGKLRRRPAPPRQPALTPFKAQRGDAVCGRGRPSARSTARLRRPVVGYRPRAHRLVPGALQARRAQVRLRRHARARPDRPGTPPIGYAGVVGP